MPSRPEDGVELLAVGLGHQPVREQSAAEVSSDAGLVNAARGGDREAFGLLYNRYARMVHGVLLARVPVSDVDDLVQDVFMTSLRHLSALRDNGRFGAWLATIARNLANDYYRRSAPEDQLADDTADSESGNRGSSGDRDGAAAILDAVRSLSDAYRETLILRLVEGMTGPEIAARTGMTHGSVRVNLHRGMQLLRAKLDSSAEGKDPEQETR